VGGSLQEQTDLVSHLWLHKVPEVLLVVGDIEDAKMVRDIVFSKPALSSLLTKGAMTKGEKRKGTAFLLKWATKEQEEFSKLIRFKSRRQEEAAVAH